MARFSSPLDLAELSDPAPPVAGRRMLYFRSDGHLYMQNNAGVITQVDGSGAAAGTTTAARSFFLGA